MPVLSADVLQKVTSDIFMAVGASEAVAGIVARSLVAANLSGHDSHGVIRIIEYLKRIYKGNINPSTEPEIVKETPTTILVDGRWGFGQVVATWATEQIIAKARTYQMASAAVYNCGHVGLVGSYAAMAAEKDMVGLAFVNGGGTEPRVVPFGGSRPLFGTNPLAAALPVRNRPPIVMDFSTAVVASGKIRVCRDKGELLPEGWILDSDGRPSREPSDYYSGGMLLPAAGHKGYALGLLVEALGGLLSGAGTLIIPDSGYKVGNGVFMMALNVEAFLPADQFMTLMNQMWDHVKAVPPMEQGGEVLLPGELEQRMKAVRLAEGIPVPETTWKAIVEAATKLRISIPL